MIIKNVLFDDIRPLHHIARNVLACYVQIRVCLQVVLTLAEEKFCVKKVTAPLAVFCGMGYNRIKPESGNKPLGWGGFNPVPNIKSLGGFYYGC